MPTKGRDIRPHARQGRPQFMAGVLHQAGLLFTRRAQRLDHRREGGGQPARLITARQPGPPCRPAESIRFEFEAPGGGHRFGGRGEPHDGLRDTTGQPPTGQGR